jgi:hypothetical protein
MVGCCGTVMNLWVPFITGKFLTWGALLERSLYVVSHLVSE